VAIGIHVTGVDEIRRIAAALRSISNDRTIINKVSREIRAEAGPAIRPAVRASAPSCQKPAGRRDAW
jgi:hypothetical protein